MNDSKKAVQTQNNPSSGETSKPNTEAETQGSAPNIEVVLLPTAKKDLDSIGRGKHQAQVAAKISSLETDALPNDARPIRGENFKQNGWNFYRVDVGEYRIVYDLDEESQTLTIVTIAVIAARNDDKVYRLMGRCFG